MNRHFGREKIQITNKHAEKRLNLIHDQRNVNYSGDTLLYFAGQISPTIGPDVDRDAGRQTGCLPLVS